jgi:hypothetical protein
MTATYGETGLSYDAINWSYDGTELNLGPYDPTVFLDAEGPYIVSRETTGSLALLAETGTAASFTSAGAYGVPMAASGRNVDRTASGVAVSYTATGVIEDGD